MSCTGVARQAISVDALDAGTDCPLRDIVDGHIVLGVLYTLVSFLRLCFVEEVRVTW